MIKAASTLRVMKFQLPFETIAANNNSSSVIINQVDNESTGNQQITDN